MERKSEGIRGRCPPLHWFKKEKKNREKSYAFLQFSLKATQLIKTAGCAGFPSSLESRVGVYGTQDLLNLASVFWHV